MQILVTGAAGFIGSHLAERLASLGHAVRGLDALTPYYDPSIKRARLEGLAEAGVEPMHLDLVDDNLASAVRDVEIVYHLAAQPGLSSRTPRRAFVRNNVRATERLLDALSGHAGLEAFFHISSSSVYGANATGCEQAPPTPISAYGQTKLEAERAVQATAEHAPWDGCILRLFSVYGPRERPDKLIHKALRCAQTGRAFPLYAGSEEHRRSFTYVGDAVDGLTAALYHVDRCRGTILNLGTPTSATTRRVLDLVAEAVGTPLCIDRVPPREGDQRRTCAQIQKAQRLLNFSPSTGLRAGIAAEAAWLNERQGR
ncbi:MAG: NAD-dependent epimerase/dehydratase family protein [Salinibacter sp.]